MDEVFAVVNWGREEVEGDFLQLMQRLQTVNRLPQIPLLQQVHQILPIQPYPFRLAYFLQLVQLNFSRYGFEPELHTPRRHGLNNSIFILSQCVLRNIVADDAESGVGAVVLDYTSEGALGVFRH